MVSGGGVGRAGGGVEKLNHDIYDLDEDNHKYHVVKKNLTLAQAKEERRKYRRKKSAAMYLPVSQQLIFRTVGKGPRRRVCVLRKKMNWRPRDGNQRRHSHEPRIFPGKHIIGDSEVKLTVRKVAR